MKLGQNRVPAVGPDDLAELYGAGIDDHYERQAKECARVGHDLFAGMQGQRETLRCGVCGIRFIEEDL